MKFDGKLLPDESLTERDERLYAQGKIFEDVAELKAQRSRSPLVVLAICAVIAIFSFLGAIATMEPKHVMSPTCLTALYAQAKSFSQSGVKTPPNFTVVNAVILNVERDDWVIWLSDEGTVQNTYIGIGKTSVAPRDSFEKLGYQVMAACYPPR